METFLQMAERHREADQLAKGRFEYDGSACSVGCFNHDLGQRPGDFRALSLHTGYPEWVHRLQEAVFEGLSLEAAKDWHVDFAKKCEKVTDWDSEYHRIMIGILKISLPNDTSNPSVVQMYIDLHKIGAEVSDDKWSAAWSAAESAAESAWSAAWSAAQSAARSAARSAWSDISKVFLNIE